MPRIAGDKKHYTFVLRNENTGKYDERYTIALPSVTSIIGAVLAKPALIGWTYYTTLDCVAGVAGALLEDMPASQFEEILDMLSDGDMLREYLKENGITPDAITKEAQDRGTREHAYLEFLAKAYIEAGEEDAHILAAKGISAPKASPWQKGICGWFLETAPKVISAEEVVYSTRYGYAGTGDITWMDNDGYRIITDLKTRKEGAKAYEGDHLQGAGLAIATEEQTGELIDRTTVLVVREDGSWEEYESTLDRTAFLDVLSVYNKLKEA